MQMASALLKRCATPTLRHLHRETVTRAPWGGPAARARKATQKRESCGPPRDVAAFAFCR